MVVKAVSRRGNETTYNYSLSGVTAAADKMIAECTVAPAPRPTLSADLTTGRLGGPFSFAAVACVLDGSPR